MKKILFLFFVLCLSISNNIIGQAKKPTIMVIPSKVWCISNGYFTKYNNQGVEEKIPDYKKALENRDLNNVIVKIGNLMQDRGFELISLSNAITSINNSDAENSVIRTKKGSKLSESPFDKVRNIARADIIIEVDWSINNNGPKHSITYTLVGLDSYTTTQIAGSQGTGTPSFSADVSVLLEEAVISHMDDFNNRLQEHFNNLLTNGREVVIELRIPDNGSDLNFEKEFNGKELSDIIDEWFDNNTVNSRYTKATSSENIIKYNQVRIPLYKQNNKPMDTEYFTKQLRNYLKQPPYNITSKVISLGLGKCMLIVGEK